MVLVHSISPSIKPPQCLYLVAFLLPVPWPSLANSAYANPNLQAQERTLLHANNL